MRFGCFGFTKDIETIARAGYDSAELDIMEIAGMSDADFAAFRKRALALGIGLDAFSGCMPLTERMHDPAFDRGHWMAHFRRAADRTALLGARLWPFGAGKCRSIPENCADVAGAKERVRTFVYDLCEILAPYGITLVVEPLGPANSNYLQHIDETVAFAKTVGLPNCRVMCDLRHIVKSGDRLEAIAEYRDWILHAHIDYPLGDLRFFPKENDGFDYAPYIRALSAAHYNCLLTVEATKYEDLASDAAGSLALFTKLGIK